MPTLRGLRRRGYPARAIRAFCREVGTTRTNSRQNIEALESYVRRELNATAQRRMAVLRPLRLVIDNWPVDASGAPVVEYFEVTNNPENEADGTRQVAFSGELWIETEDFAEVPPPKFFRLSPGREVRLRGAYLVTATGVEKDEDGTVTAVHATYDPATRGGDAPDGRKVKSTMHWVSAAHAVPITAALYERLFTAAVPGEGDRGGPGRPEPGFPRAARQLLRRGRARRHRAGRRRAVRATGLLRSRSGHPCAVPPHGGVAGRMGGDPEAQGLIRPGAIRGLRKLPP